MRRQAGDRRWGACHCRGGAGGRPARACAPWKTPATGQLEYLLQARDDPSLLISLGEVWSGQVDALRVLDGRIDQPLEAVRAGLESAASYFPPDKRFAADDAGSDRLRANGRTGVRVPGRRGATTQPMPTSECCCPPGGSGARQAEARPGDQADSAGGESAFRPRRGDLV